MARPHDSATRERILLESSRLFARRGYYGSTTRDIAEAVGVRQPSLFHHFASKSAILSALIDVDVGSSIALLESVLELELDHAGRLHLYMAQDTLNFLTQAFDARGFYTDAVFAEAEFAPQRKLLQRLHSLTQDVVAAGIEAGEFVQVDVVFVQRAATGILNASMRERGSEPVAESERPLQLADFVLAALLPERGRLDEIRRGTISRLHHQ
jgi:AcrR family transcriptional regulator